MRRSAIPATLPAALQVLTALAGPTRLRELGVPEGDLKSRQQVIDRYGLIIVSTRDDVSQTARISERTVDAVRHLVAEPVLEDTDGIDRGAARIPSSTWPPSQRRRFYYWWLRLHALRH